MSKLIYSKKQLAKEKRNEQILSAFEDWEKEKSITFTSMCEGIAERLGMTAMGVRYFLIRNGKYSPVGKTAI